MNDLFLSRYFVKDDPIIKKFNYGDLHAEFFNRGWWSRIYEYEWIRSIYRCFFDKWENYSAIDIATGIQHPTMFILKDSGFSKVVGTDLFKKKYFSYSRYLGNGIEYISDNLLQPRITEKFDCVSCISVLEHLKLEEQEVAMNNLIGYLKPKGCIMLTFDMPGFEYKTDLEFYKNILLRNKFDLKCVNVNEDSIVKTSTCPNAAESLRKLNLSCYRVFAWK